MKLPAASGRGIKVDLFRLYLGGHVVPPQIPLPHILPHRERLGYSEGK